MATESGNLSSTRATTSAIRPANTLASQIDRHLAFGNRLTPPIPGLTLHRWEHPTEPVSYMLSPSICLIGQGQKRLFLGEDAFVYDCNTFLITSIELPVVSQITEASHNAPYLGLTMELNLKIISQLMIDNPVYNSRQKDDRLGVAVSDLSADLRGAFERLLALLDQPDDIPTLAPLIQQEIFYRLLKSDQGPRLRNIITSGSHSHQIARVIEWLKTHFKHPVRIEDLASDAGLSVSAFHSHFRAMTAMTPLQFIKRIRLSEARRLMLAEQLEAAQAAYEVGYESPSQFSREYSRMFGAPPIKDIRQLAASGMR